MKIVWYGKAEQDLERATNYIEVRNPLAADKVEQRLLRAIENLRLFPNAGRLGRKPGTREVVIADYPYIIRYRVKDAVVQILRIFHTSMQWPNI